MPKTAPQLALTRIVNAPGEQVYQSFADPEQFAAWWGPLDNSLDKVEVDLRPGGYMRWTEVFPDDPDLGTDGRIDLSEVVDGELLDGVMRISGNLPGGYEPFETRMRIEFYDEGDGRTRLEVSQWLPDNYVAPTENGWAEAFSKLDALLGV